MEILPKTLGTRPRLAVEVRAEGVVAARAEDANALLTAVTRANLAEGAVAPGLKVGNIVNRTAVTAALGGVDEAEAPVLVVNAGVGTVTTAIVQAGVLTLHRSVDMSAGDMSVGGNVPLTVTSVLPVVSRESTAQEWARQEPLGPGGWD